MLGKLEYLKTNKDVNEKKRAKKLRILDENELVYTNVVYICYCGENQRKRKWHSR
jgi:hypothetical protein